MTAVRILHDGGIGEYKAGNVVQNPHPGLVYMAENKVTNAADGKLLCEFVEGEADTLDDLRTKAKELGVKGNISTMKQETLEAKIAEAQDGQKEGE